MVPRIAGDAKPDIVPPSWFHRVFVTFKLLSAARKIEVVERQAGVSILLDLPNKLVEVPNITNFGTVGFGSKIASTIRILRPWLRCSPLHLHGSRATCTILECRQHSRFLPH